MRPISEEQLTSFMTEVPVKDRVEAAPVPPPLRSRGGDDGDYTQGLYSKYMTFKSKYLDRIKVNVPNRLGATFY